MRYSSVIIRSFFLLSAEAVILAVRALILEMESDADFLDERSVAKNVIDLDQASEKYTLREENANKVSGEIGRGTIVGNGQKKFILMFWALH
jgi:hypothetical protein